MVIRALYALEGENYTTTTTIYYYDDTGVVNKGNSL